MSHVRKSELVPYPKAGVVGGSLIREVISFLKEKGCTLPLSSHILIATSGGIDSVGLAHLLIHYGRRVVDRSKIQLLHINHGWRAQESDQDEVFVQSLGKKWGIPVISHRLVHCPDTLSEKKSVSWEEVARNFRKDIFAKEGKNHQALIFTAHQADDLAETLLWRLFTGASDTHGGGIAFQHGREVRPLLRVRKLTLQRYLKEVGQIHREDSTNHEGRFLRSKMRQILMPEVEKLFPKSVEHLVDLALRAQERVKFSDNSVDLPSELEDHFNKPGEIFEFFSQAAGLRMRRPHLKALKEMSEGSVRKSELSLPGGWTLSRSSEAHRRAEEGIEK